MTPRLLLRKLSIRIREGKTFLNFVKVCKHRRGVIVLIGKRHIGKLQKEGESKGTLVNLLERSNGSVGLTLIPVILNERIDALHLDAAN